jgi:antitoxin (DNA-binding transcriptional repressor) of toxin-antitoxin stability system
MKKALAGEVVIIASHGMAKAKLVPCPPDMGLQPGLIQSLSQALWPGLPAWGLLGGIASSLC